ncbi:hypothetical protein NL108_009643 [Boleophthalmus pectinirostris]|uniref:uncharacterized protein LOC129409753 n=1 Tax=Boleophthalmus pectinirostris TaxID=150288 RepID=UPI00243264D8|nr:uncharacterized protein LOC129409753 [Boleophthalmus pectinirostris]KAJ0055702.1 hypothetical protein NL108_009643 [Boleophthalmus pectinirostris]
MSTFPLIRFLAVLPVIVTTGHTATVCVSPDSLQLHTYEYISISCPSEWTVFRQTRFKPTPEKCGGSWGSHKGMNCKVDPTLISDTGLYWCQNQHNQTKRSSAANITISKEKLILESPLFPVKEGQQVTLRCSFKNSKFDDPTSNFNASFFLNGSFLGWFPGGQMVLSSVTQNQHQGLYHCMHPNQNQSLQSLLIVEPNDAPSSSVPSSSVQPTSPPWPKEIPLFRLLCFLALVVLYTFILGISISIYCKWTRARAEQKQQESERVSLQRIRDA